MQAAQKRKTILRLLAVGCPVLLTLVLFILTISRIGNLGSSSSPRVGLVTDAKFSDVAVSNSPAFPSKSAAMNGELARAPMPNGPLLAPAHGALASVNAANNRSTRGGQNLVVPQTIVQSEPYQPSQPLSEALEAMADQESADPLGDDLFLNTTSLEKLNQELIPEVRAGFNLGKSGAIYAAREQFIYVLRRVAVAKDAKEQSDRHMKALARGLRALDEADDFTPRGDSIEAELDTLAISGSHVTPVLKNDGVIYDEITPEILTPHQASAEYARYAAKQLSEAMAEEEAGSMALYGLGKTFARLEAQSKDATAGLKCNVMYRAAAIAHPDNYLAANELGVRLAKAGQYQSARRVLQLAARQPANATVFENLAAVERKLGNDVQAAQIQQAGEQIAMRERMQSEVSRRHGVAWVSPDEFRSAGPNQPNVPSQPNGPQAASHPVIQQTNQAMPRMAQQIPQPTKANAQPSPGGWKTALNYVKKATGWEKENQKITPTPNYNRTDSQFARRPGTFQQGTPPQYR